MHGTPRICRDAAGEPVAAEIAHPRIAEQFLPTNFRDSGPSHLLATTGRTGAWNRDVYSADAEGADANEPAIGDRDQRSEWSYRTKNRACHRGRRARSAEVG